MTNLSIQAKNETQKFSFDDDDDLLIINVDFESTLANCIWYAATIINIMVVNITALSVLKLKGKSLKIFLI